MSKAQIKSLRERAAVLRAELDDDTCRKFEAARQCVRQRLDETLAQLDAAEPHVGGAA